MLQLQGYKFIMEPEFKRVKKTPSKYNLFYTGTRNTEENILIHKIAPEKTFAKLSTLPFSLLPEDKGQKLNNY